MKLITILGPTAVGKTSVAVAVAKRIQGEIISADSRQIYRHMSIGTAQPDEQQRQTVRFHCIDFVDPGVSYSCGQFARDAEDKISDVIARHRIPIICGGTGLYIKALFDPLHPLPESDPGIKCELIRRLQKEGLETLYKRLQDIDPEWAQKIDPHDKQRILRGLEVYEMTNTPLSVLTTDQKRSPRYEPVYIGLHLPRNELNQKIDRRVDDMIEQDLVCEVQTLLQMHFDPACNALRTIGYREIIAYLNGAISLHTAIAQVKQHTRQYAKRQCTWFRRLPGVQWHDPGDKNLVTYLAHYVQEANS